MTQGDPNWEEAESAREVLGALYLRIDDLEAKLAAAVTAIEEMANGRSPSDLPEMHVSNDRPWACDGCGRWLGTYDPDDDIVRVRRRDFYAWMHGGTDGWIEVVCWHCGCRNRAG